MLVSRLLKSSSRDMHEGLMEEAETRMSKKESNKESLNRFKINILS